MPTLPLYTPSATPDASHRVVAPGGYEAWHFDAGSDSGALRVVATVGVGDPFHAEYLSRYLRYRRRPTRVPPPLPWEYPWARLAVYEGARLLARFTAHPRPGEFTASASRPEVNAGANGFMRDADCSLALRLQGQSSDASGPISARLTFRPLAPHGPHETAVLPASTAGDEHRWVVADPWCDVSGTVTVPGREIDFRGRGYHDHTYGTGPLLTAMRRGVRGRILLRDRAVAFYIAEPVEQHLPVEVRLVDAGAQGVREVAGVRELTDGFAAATRWRRTARSGLYPGALHLHGPALDLKLTAPAVLESPAGHVHMTYSAASEAYAGQALCEVWAATRSPWRLPGRMTGPAAGRGDGIEHEPAGAEAAEVAEVAEERAERRP
jgi:hypothetical protein